MSGGECWMSEEIKDDNEVNIQHPATVPPRGSYFYRYLSYCPITLVVHVYRR